MSKYWIYKTIIRTGVGIALIITLSTPQITTQANTYTVTNTNESGAYSLQQAIADSNLHTGADTIEFNIPMSDPNYDSATGIWTITDYSGTFAILDNYTNIAGLTQATNQGDTNPNGPEIEVHGYPGTFPIFSIQATSCCTILQGLIITGGTIGIEMITPNGSNTIISNIIGLKGDGTAGGANGTGIAISNGNSNYILNNIISNNTGSGIQITNSDNNRIRNNSIGLSQFAPNVGNEMNGVLITGSSTGNVIGGESSYKNVISQNAENGIKIDGASANEISYNYIGTGGAGAIDLGNLANGVLVTGGADDVVIKNNLISGNNQHGIYVNGPGIQNTVITSNGVGSNSSYDGVIPNGWHGVAIYGNELVDPPYFDGPTGTDIRYNSIFGNGWSGLVIKDASGSYIGDNRIGVSLGIDSAGLGNAFFGIHILGPDNQISYGYIANNGLANPTDGDGIRVGTDVDAYNHPITASINGVSVYSNGGKGIENINGGNDELEGPVLDENPSCTHVSGTVPLPYGGAIDIYSGPDDEGKTWLDSVTPDGAGHFEWTGYIPGPYVSATWTRSSGPYSITSEFSAYYFCGRNYLPLIRKP
jgi:parallel beta-helix repeat protein